MTGASERVRADDPLWADLAHGTAQVALTPATVQFALLRDGAADLGRDLVVTPAPAQVEIAF